MIKIIAEFRPETLAKLEYMAAKVGQSVSEYLEYLVLVKHSDFVLEDDFTHHL